MKCTTRTRSYEKSDKNPVSLHRKLDGQVLSQQSQSNFTQTFSKNYQGLINNKKEKKTAHFSYYQTLKITASVKPLL